MKKIKCKFSINWIILLIFIFLPGFIVKVSILKDYEVYGRFIAISVITVIAPLFILWQSLPKKTQKLNEMSYKEKKTVIFLKTTLLLLSFFGLYFLTYGYIKDTYYILNHEIPTITGKTINVYRPSHAFLFGYQSYRIDSGEKKYQSFFSSEMFREGDNVKIWYLPNSQMILKAEKTN